VCPHVLFDDLFNALFLKLSHDAPYIFAGRTSIAYFVFATRYYYPVSFDSS